MPDNERWRNDPERYRYRDDDRRRDEEWGYPRGRRGEPRGGSRGSWFAGGNGDYRPASEGDVGFDERRSGRGMMRREERDEFGGRERDYGDSAGYGGGGSALDWRDVEGERRRDRGREPGFTDLAFGHGFGSGYEGRDYSGERHGERRHGRDRDRDERGLLERAGDEIASWFGADTSEPRRGEHRGRGPKGYQRSDERIRDDVNDRLTDDPHIDASDIEVLVAMREVTLSGTVASRFEKRHAEDLAESVSGVTHVQNNLRVRQAAGTDAGLLAGGGTMGGVSGAGGTNV